MELSRKQFDILETLVEHPGISQRELASITGYSLGLINNTLKELNDNDLVLDNHVSDKGKDALEPYRVKRAVFVAAGFGTRLVPVTLNTPKPLVRVCGTRIIDTMIDALLEIGVTDITIVRGYLAEQFDQLLYKYPTIKFIENPAFNESNNISSLMCARYSLENAYILEADLLLLNKKIFKKYHYQSNYLGIKKERSDDWCFEVKDGIIKNQKIGGKNVYQEIGISYWTSDDGKKLSEDIKVTYEMPGGHERFWDSVVFEYFSKNYKVEIRECKESDVVEIDSFKELQAIDKTYLLK